MYCTQFQMRIFYLSFLSKYVIDRVKTGLNKDETMILCTIHRVSVYVHIHAHTVLQQFSETNF